VVTISVIDGSKKMANGAKVAMAVGAGYLLGRTRKMRVALMLAAAGVTGKFPGGPTQLVAQGLKSLGASADVSQLSQQLRGELLAAARAAAVAAATHQVDSLNDRLQGVTSTVGADEVLEDVGDTVDQVSEPVSSLTGLGRKRRRDARRDDEDDLYEGDDETYEDDEPLDVEEDFDEDEGDELDDDLETEPEDDEPQAARPRRRATAQGTDRAPRRRAATATKRAPVRRGR
jgi:hypothetical protein